MGRGGAHYGDEVGDPLRTAVAIGDREGRQWDRDVGDRYLPRRRLGPRLGATRPHSSVLVWSALLSYGREEVERDAKLAMSLRSAREEREDRCKNGHGKEKT